MAYKEKQDLVLTMAQKAAARLAQLKSSRTSNDKPKTITRV